MHPRRTSPPKDHRRVYDLGRVADQIRRRLDAGKPVRLLEETAMLVERGLHAAAALLEVDDRNLYRIETYDERHNLIQVLGTLHGSAAARAAWVEEVANRQHETVILLHRGRAVMRHDAVPRPGDKPQPVTTFGRMRALGMITADCVCACGSRTTVNAIDMPATETVKSLGEGMRCMACGTLGLTVQMNLGEYFRIIDGREEFP